MEGAIALLILAGILALWIIAFVRMQAYGGSKGVSRFFLMLLLLLVLEGLAFVIVVAPVLGCSGWFCGLGELIIFLLISGVFLVAFPIIMMTAMVATLKRNRKDADVRVTGEKIRE